jgi:hypothetical protein
MATVLENILSAIGLGSKEFKQDLQLAKLNDILAKIISNPNIEPTQLSVLSQLQGLLLLAPGNATKALQQQILDALTQPVASMGGDIAFLLSHGSTTRSNNVDLNRTLKNVGNISVFGGYDYVQANTIFNGRSDPKDACKFSKIFLEIDYTIANVAGGNAVLTLQGNTQATPTYPSPQLFFRNTQNVLVNTISIPRNTRTFICIDHIIPEKLFLNMAALPSNFVVNSDQVRIINAWYQLC